MKIHYMLLTLAMLLSFEKAFSASCSSLINQSDKASSVESEETLIKTTVANKSISELSTAGAFLTRILRRYYISHTVLKTVLGKAELTEELAKGSLSTRDLIRKNEVELDPSQLKLLPLSSLHEDGHMVRREDWVENRNT